jgi:hypothetical protein
MCSTLDALDDITKLNWGWQSHVVKRWVGWSIHESVKTYHSTGAREQVQGPRALAEVEDHASSCNNATL